jgi:S1-C subfamily serine protease
VSLSETSSHVQAPARADAACPAPSGRLASAARPVATLAAASLLGGVVALGGAWAVGAFDDPAPVVEATPVASQPSAGAAARTGATGIDVADIYRRSGPGVVQITSTSQGQSGVDVFGNPVQGQAQQALGSGFVIDKDGHIVTNYHVVQGASRVEVSFSNQDTVKAQVVGTDPSTDLALLEVSAPAKALTPLTLANSDAVQVGDPVVAIGNPFGLDRTVTAGIVSALQREVRSPNNYTIDHVIQTDAPINSGNSGGPLIDAQGRVIGVNSQIETANGGGGNVGIGFAVPSNTVKSVVAQLLVDGRVDRAFLGVTLQDVSADAARVLRLPSSTGVLVGSVQPGSAAAKAGVKGGSNQVVVAGESYQLGGDMIVAMDGKRIGSVDALRAAIAAHKPGDKVSVTVVHANGTRATLAVVLGRAPTTQAP